MQTMKNIQLGLFGGEIRPSGTKNSGVQRHNGQKINSIANQILKKMENESLEFQQSVICEIYYRTICANLDKMPRENVQGLIVKLVERYIE